LVYGDARHGPGGLNLPLGQALAAPRQEDGDGIGRADDALPQLEEALDQLDRLDVRHGRLAPHVAIIPSPLHPEIVS
jgi:hypothetical protein